MYNTHRTILERADNQRITWLDPAPLQFVPYARTRRITREGTSGNNEVDDNLTPQNNRHPPLNVQMLPFVNFHRHRVGPAEDWIELDRW